MYYFLYIKDRTFGVIDCVFYAFRNYIYLNNKRNGDKDLGVRVRVRVSVKGQQGQGSVY